MRNLKTMLTVIATLAVAATSLADVREVKSGADALLIDGENLAVAFTATVVKDCSQPSVCDWGKRGQAFIGSKGGKMEPFFVFVTEVNRTEVDKAVREVGIESRRQISKADVPKHQGLKGTTKKEDYLNGDPVLVALRFEKEGKAVEVALEDLIEEKIIVDGQEVVKPYTPHFVYHGTAEAINFPSGCIVCPSDCNGGIITDNALPLLTTTSQFKVDWTRMPAPGTKVTVVFKSVRGGPQAKKG